MTQDIVDQLKLSNLKGLHLSSMEVFLTWNRDQLETILQDQSRVCLPSDYGTGIHVYNIVSANILNFF